MSPSANLQTVRYYLKRVGTSKKHKWLELDPAKKYTFGRSSRTSYQLVSRFMSREHASLKFKRKQWILKDNGSSNGTYCDNEKLENDRSIVKVGARIGFGVDVSHYDEPENFVYSLEYDEEDNQSESRNVPRTVQEKLQQLATTDQHSTSEQPVATLIAQENLQVIANLVVEKLRASFQNQNSIDKHYHFTGVVTSTPGITDDPKIPKFCSPGLKKERRSSEKMTSKSSHLDAFRPSSAGIGSSTSNLGKIKDELAKTVDVGLQRGVNCVRSTKSSSRALSSSEEESDVEIRPKSFKRIKRPIVESESDCENDAVSEKSLSPSKALDTGKNNSPNVKMALEVSEKKDSSQEIGEKSSTEKEKNSEDEESGEESWNGVVDSILQSGVLDDSIEDCDDSGCNQLNDVIEILDSDEEGPVVKLEPLEYDVVKEELMDLDMITIEYDDYCEILLKKEPEERTGLIPVKLESPDNVIMEKQGTCSANYPVLSQNIWKNESIEDVQIKEEIPEKEDQTFRNVKNEYEKGKKTKPAKSILMSLLLTGPQPEKKAQIISPSYPPAIETRFADSNGTKTDVTSGARINLFEEEKEVNLESAESLRSIPIKCEKTNE